MIKKTIDHLNLKQTADSGQCFRWKRIDDNTYSVIAFDKRLVISGDGPEFLLDCSEEEWNSIWSLYLDLSTDYDYVEKLILASGDSHLKDAFEKGNGIRILNQDLWEMIVSFIISQNNNIPRIKNSIEAICKKAGFEVGDTKEYRLPKPFETKPDFFLDKSLGLGYRDQYLEELYEFAKCNPDWVESLREMDYETVRKELLKRKGIGPKVADCISLFGLHHIEAFPVDTHVKQLLEKYYPNGFDHDYFAGFAGIIQQYLFYYEIK